MKFVTTLSKIYMYHKSYRLVIKDLAFYNYIESAMEEIGTTNPE